MTTKNEYKTRTFSKEFMLEEILDNKEYMISNEVIGKRRWSIDHEIVFKFEDKFYATTYSVGATEMQDEGPWEYENEVECNEVQPVEKVVIVYKPIKVEE